METVFAETHRLRFRNLRPSDYEAVCSFRSDPAACRYAADPLSHEEVTAHIARCKDGWSRREGETLCLGAELRSDGTVVGEAMIRYVSLRDRHAESRVALAPRCFRTGLGLELALATLRYCFDELHMHRVSWFIDVKNEAALGLARRMGMTQEGTLRQHTQRGGTWHDEHIVSLLEHEWPAVRERFRRELGQPPAHAPCSPPLGTASAGARSADAEPEALQ